MATLLDIVALDIEANKLPGKTQIIESTIKDLKEVLLAMADIADRIVTYDVGEPPADHKLTMDTFESYFNTCMGQNKLADVFASIEQMEPPRSADLNYLLARDLVLKGITNYAELIDKIVVGIAVKYMNRS